MKKTLLSVFVMLLLSAPFTFAEKHTVRAPFPPLVTLKESPIYDFITLVTPTERTEMIRKSAVVAIRPNVGQAASEGEGWEETSTWHELVIEYGNETKVYKTKQPLAFLKKLLSKN